MTRIAIGSLCRAVRRLHGDERGLVVVLFVLIGLVFAILIAMNWDVGRVISAKMRAQAAADQAALAAATWQSRALNIITGTNILILHNASAEVSARAVETVLREVPQRWDQALQDCGDEPDGPCFQATLEQILEVEAGPYIEFAARCGEEAGAALSDGVFLRRIDELHDFQRRFLASIPGTIEEQTTVIEEFHGVALALAVPGRDYAADGGIFRPVELGSAASFEAILRVRRELRDNLQNPSGFVIADPGGNHAAMLDLLREFDDIGDGLEIWNEAVEAAIVAVSALMDQRHYVLPGQAGGVEFGPATSGRARFTVFATAEIPDIHSRSFLFDRFFDFEVTPSDSAFAAAQAEAFNGYDEVFGQMNQMPRYGFRVWSQWGWNWQPRLTWSDLAPTALLGDTALQEMWARAGVLSDSYESVQFGLLH